MLVGIDEAGRGPVLGPLVIGVCAVPEEAETVLRDMGVRDSKDLSAKQRKAIEAWFLEQCETFDWFGGTVVIQAEQIDQALQAQGLNWLEVDGFREALKLIPMQQHVRITADACDVNAERFTQRITAGLDGWPWPHSSMVSEHKADQHHPVVAMASILAKEERDRSMAAMSTRVGTNVGSGYPADPATKQSLHTLVRQNGIDYDVRWGWATVKRFWEEHRQGDVPVRGVPRTTQQRLFQPPSVKHFLKGNHQHDMSDMDWQPDADTEALIRHVALQNALEYEGKAAIGSVIGRIMAMRGDLRQHGKAVTGLVAQQVNAANAMAGEDGLDAVRSVLEAEAPHLLEKRETKARREGLPELKNAEKGKVVLRFAPNPNGPLSFGHARGLVINSTYREMYDGEFILRFDDTDTKVKPPMLQAYQTIQEETEWLTGRKPDRVVVASDRIDEYHRHAEMMLESGFGYVCRCTAESFKEYRASKTACPCRTQTPQDNLILWKRMLDGKFKPGEAVVRVKTDMTLKNPALRDWPALRLQDTTAHPHPRPEIGSTHVVWPLLDFQSAVEDHLQGVTHIIRGKDLMDSTRKQTLLYEHFGWTYPETMYWGRVKVHEWGGFSTSQMRSDIEEGTYTGWDDPRLPTLAGLKRRGTQASALRNFWLELGITQKDISVPLATLYSHNTKVIDDEAPRLTFVRHAADFTLEGSYPATLDIPVHPNHASMGHRTWNLADGRIWLESEDLEKMDLRLKEFADVALHDRAAQIESMERSDKRPIVHWLPDSNATEAVLTGTKDNGVFHIEGRLEINDHPVGTIVQLERVGYAKIMDDSTLMLCHEELHDN